VDRDAFLDVLRQSRLLPEPQVAEIAEEFGGATTAAIASSLISRGLLTPFQARRLTDGQSRGLVLGQYRLLEEVGEGGFGHVYKALHVVMGRQVAIKVISPEVVEEAQARSWFRREVRAATQLYHPNIVMAYDANEADGLLFLVMEYVDGCDLETLVKRQGPLSISVACTMLRQAAAALQYAHDRGMVHRDVKPANLLVPRQEEQPKSDSPMVKVVDFGLARLHRSAGSNSLSVQGEKGFIGTPDYASPEQIRDASTVDGRSDLYCLGCTFYYALAGRKPFRGDTVFETIFKHLEEEAPPLETVRPEVPPGISAVVRRLMAKDPNHRFQTPAELIAELDFLFGKEGTPAGGGWRVEGKGNHLPSTLHPPLSTPPEPPPPRPERPIAISPRKSNPTATRFIPDLALGAAPAVSPSATAEAPWEPPPGLTGVSATAQLDSPPSTAEGALTAMSEDPDRTVLLGESENESPASTSPQLDSVLRARWRQWVAIVEVFARGGAETDVDEGGYRVLHRELLEACRARSGPGLGPLGRLESLVEPWLTPHTLASAGHEVLSGLLIQCLQLEGELFGSVSSSGAARWALLFLVGLLAGLVGLYWRAPGGWKLPARPTLVSLWAVVENHPVLSSAVVLPAVVLLSITILSRLFRS
jgi:serine/threonine protein kinase